MPTLTGLHEEIDEILPGLIADRRYLHENPELGFQEVKTSAFVIDRLRALGVGDIRTGVNGTGVTGLVVGTAAGPGQDRVALIRADMDALPIHEENDVEYRSQVDGKMHACGHDAHTAILLGLARTLIGRAGRLHDHDSGAGRARRQAAPGDRSDRRRRPACDCAPDGRVA